MSVSLSVAGKCQRCHADIEQGDLRCAICATQVPTHRAEGVSALVVDILRCDGCGAAVSYDIAVQAPKCGFCGSVMHLEKVQDPMEQTAWWGHFTVAADEADTALQRWFGKLGFLRPSDLSQIAIIEGLKPLWWVAWVFDANAAVSWTADSNEGSGRSDWAPHAGQTELEFQNILVSASRGLTKAETRALTRGYSLTVGSNARPERKGAVVEQFDVQRSEARGQVLDAASAVAAGRIKASHIPGSRFRKVNVELVLRGLQTKRCAFPAYVLAYRYRGKLYRAVINGQDTRYVTGQAPYSIFKLAGLALASVALGAAVVAMFWA